MARRSKQKVDLNLTTGNSVIPQKVYAQLKLSRLAGWAAMMNFRSCEDSYEGEGDEWAVGSVEKRKHPMRFDEGTDA